MFYSKRLGMLAISQNSIACPVFVQFVTECTWSKTFQSYLSKDVEIIRNQWLIKKKFSQELLGRLSPNYIRSMRIFCGSKNWPKTTTTFC